jgi:hypothetical protein
MYMRIYIYILDIMWIYILNIYIFSINHYFTASFSHLKQKLSDTVYIAYIKLLFFNIFHKLISCAYTSLTRTVFFFMLQGGKTIIAYFTLTYETTRNCTYLRKVWLCETANVHCSVTVLQKLVSTSSTKSTTESKLRSPHC